MTKAQYDKEVQYLTSVIESKNELIAHYKMRGNMGAVSVLQLELDRVEARLTLLQLNNLYNVVSQEVTHDDLAKLFE